jgi:hypothetical protein
MQVLSNIDPGTLFAMSQASKVLRAMLWKAVSTVQSIWDEALRNTGAPLCPSDCSMPSYLALLFGRECTVSAHSIPCT